MAAPADILAAPQGAAPPLIEAFPGFFDEIKKPLVESGAWDDPRALTRIIAGREVPFLTFDTLTVQTEFPNNVYRYIHLVGLRERLGQLTALSPEYETWLCKAYHTLAGFPGRFFQFFQSVARDSGLAKAPLEKQMKFWSDLSVPAGNRCLFLARNLLERKDINKDQTAAILSCIDDRAGASIRQMLQAGLWEVKYTGDPEKKNQLIVLALQNGYYPLAEELWAGLDHRDRSARTFPRAEKCRRTVMTLETLRGDTYDDRLLRAGLLLELDRFDEAEDLYRDLIRENDAQIRAWNGWLRCVWQKEAPDYRRALEIIREADQKAKDKDAEFLEIKLGLEIMSIVDSLTEFTPCGQASENSGTRTYSPIQDINRDLEKKNPRLSALVSITLDFLNSMLQKDSPPMCRVPFDLYYQKLAELITESPEYVKALIMQPALALLALGHEGSLEVMTRPLPPLSDLQDKGTLRKERAKYLLASAWELQDNSRLSAAKKELSVWADEISDENKDLDWLKLMGDLSALEALLSPDDPSPAFHDALKWYQQALKRASDKTIHVLLNNILFLQVELDLTREAERTKDLILSCRLDERDQTIILLNLAPLAGDVTPDQITNRIKADPGEGAYAAAVIHAGQVAESMGDIDKRNELWALAFTGIKPCRDHQVCRTCFRPGPVLVERALQWPITFSTSRGVIIPLNIDWDFWLIHSGGRGQGAFGWPTLEEIEAASSKTLAGNRRPGPIH